MIRQAGVGTDGAEADQGGGSAGVAMSGLGDLEHRAEAGPLRFAPALSNRAE